MNSQPPEYQLTDEGPEASSLALSGDWVQGQNPASFSAVRSELSSIQPTSLTTDGSALGAWDSVLMAFLLQCHDYCHAQGIAFATRNMPPGIEKLLAVATAVEAHPKTVDDQAPPGWHPSIPCMRCTLPWMTCRNRWPLPAR